MKRGLITQVLSPAVRLWLRSQATISELQVEFSGGDRQLLRGNLPKVAIAAEQAVYQGLHLSQVALTAENIQINFGQMLKGKPLQLLAVVPVAMEVRLTQADLTASLSAALLQQALTDVLGAILQLRQDGLGGQRQQLALNCPQLVFGDQLDTVDTDQLGEQRLSFSGKYRLAQELTQADWQPFWVETTLQRLSGNVLKLENLTWRSHDPSLAPSGEQALELLGDQVLDLGTDVDLQELAIANQTLYCRGTLNINP
jgi:hypothetical protein